MILTASELANLTQQNTIKTPVKAAVRPDVSSAGARTLINLVPAAGPVVHDTDVSN